MLLQEIKSVVVATSLFIGSCNTFAAVSNQEEDDLATTLPKRCQTARMHASWAEYWQSMPDLKQHSDIGIVGEVSSVTDATKAGGPPLQTVTVRVSRVVWSRDAKTPVPDTVAFLQTGGMLEDVLNVVEGDPLLSKGEQTVVFLTEYSPGKFRVSGGPSGRFSITKEGVVAPLVEDGVKVPSGTTIDELARL